MFSWSPYAWYLYSKHNCNSNITKTHVIGVPGYSGRWTALIILIIDIGVKYILYRMKPAACHLKIYTKSLPATLRHNNQRCLYHLSMLSNRDSIEANSLFLIESSSNSERHPYRSSTNLNTNSTMRFLDYSTVQNSNTSRRNIPWTVCKFHRTRGIKSSRPASNFENTRPFERLANTTRRIPSSLIV